ncbi:MAG: lipopolysaccharide biosynthesis protein [Roseiflexus castenholzii]|uniref:Wzz/FepE/Etk N-terminal domain-containing protein n=1 Tax=Roseiflexus castenholzii TaxID=120962 RepID=UPI000CC2F87C|nr:MAG: lipopolysaccharide biosynthesis protein [Roseiflexus castenholzii]
MDTQFVHRLVRRQWRLVIVGGGFVGVLALLVSAFQSPIYQASTTVLVNQGRGTAAPDYESVLMSQQLTRTYAELLKKRPLYEMVIANLRLETTPERLMQQVRVSTIRDTQLIVVTARDRSPQRAADIANELVRLLQEQDRQLLTGSYGSGARGLSVVEPAWADAVPASPKTLRDTLLGLIFGLLGMSGIALVREYVDQTIKNGDEAVCAVGAPVLAAVSARSINNDARRRSIGDGDDTFAEDYWMLAVRTRSALADNPARSLMTTSAEPLADAHAVAVHLAAIYARLGQRVILVDADLRHPTLHSWFNLSGDTGLHAALACTHSLPVYRYLQPTSVANLMLLPAGEPVANPLILFDSPRLRERIGELYQHADFIIIAAPALISAAESLLLAQAADAALLVLRAETTPHTAAAAARALLDQARIRLPGIVLTGVPDHDAASRIGALVPAMSRPMFGNRLIESLAVAEEKPSRSISMSSASTASSQSPKQ